MYRFKGRLPPTTPAIATTVAQFGTGTKFAAQIPNVGALAEPYALRREATPTPTPTTQPCPKLGFGLRRSAARRLHQHQRQHHANAFDPMPYTLAGRLRQRAGYVPEGRLRQRLRLSYVVWQKEIDPYV